MNSHRIWEPEGIPNESFLLGDVEKSASVYEVQFFIEDKRYRYGFALDAHRILEEWLEVWSGSEFITLFTRDLADYQISPELPGENQAIAGFTRPNSLSLSAAAQNNHMGLAPIFSWFRASQVVMPARGAFPSGGVPPRHCQRKAVITGLLPGASTAPDSEEVATTYPLMGGSARWQHRSRSPHCPIIRLAVQPERGHQRLVLHPLVPIVCKFSELQLL